MDPGSKSRLTPYMAEQYPGTTLFDRLARAVCRAGCLPRKELYEAWEVARRVRRHLRGGRVLDLACGYGTLAYAMLLLDDSSPEALAVDVRRPQNAHLLASALEDEWPRLRGRVRFVEAALDSVAIEASDLVVSVHACGGLSDSVLERAVAARARVAVLPCCHHVTAETTGGLDAWMDGPLAVDATRAARLRAHGYIIRTARIPEAVTPKNRLLIGTPRP